MVLNKNILIVEDDDAINKLLSDIVSGQGYTTQSAYSGTEAMLYIKQQQWDLILLDMMLPGLSGEQVLKNITDLGTSPVIVISARDAQEVKVSALRLGADDYITKPFDVEEVSARIGSVMRRFNRSNQVIPNVLVHKDIVLDADARTVKVNDSELLLTAREFTILYTLMSSPEKVFSKANIFESAWNETFHGDDNTVNVHMSNLRNKLSGAAGEADYIETVWGMGYKMKT
ncbi:DNA-binding response regulator [Jeotgalicoccus coquinae]|uniref:Response regulator SaeR n=1 Tax=Jeotgalicoccus coquinae TaxID=709509 RepID=A0A6V7RTL9_9STAP|nr:response regulator transcription factor [Jeotgalicoccus coquinae]MBB6423326.1 DNA-binding response OmpR family regulator [Jeotgalicoccus coquinae]GGE08928.1 DNA-binding response regulator [Jeotgalicoccus coquinae]CAD2081733.1 Transcriptional regulatory protein SrrA [Jeotgalicoccus coquinae]